MCRSQRELDPGRRGRGSLRRRGCSQKRGFTSNQPRLRRVYGTCPPPRARSLWAKSSLPERARGTPSASPPPHRALVPAAGEERPPRTGQPEPRPRTSAAERPCAPHLTVSSALSHEPSPSRQASSESLSPSTQGNRGRGAKGRAQEPRKQPPEAACTAPARPVSAETARPPGAPSHIRAARRPWTKPSVLLTQRQRVRQRGCRVWPCFQGAHSPADPRGRGQGLGRAVRAPRPARGSVSGRVRSPITVSHRALSSPPLHALPAHRVLAMYPVSSFKDLTFSFQMVPSRPATGNVNRKQGCFSPSAAGFIPITKLGQLRLNQKAASSEVERPAWGK